jgi:hypothetical protein
VAAEAAGSNCFAAVYQTYGAIDDWDVSAITNLDTVFDSIQGASSFCTTGGLHLNNWDVSRVTSMIGMSHFQVESFITGYCHNLVSLPF